MVRIYESVNGDSIDKSLISKSLTSKGFKQLTSSDANSMKFSKVENDLWSNIVILTVYLDDSTKEFSISVSTNAHIDYSYLSDYMSTQEELDNWIRNDYNTVISEMRKQF